MDITQTATSLRGELEKGDGQGVTQLAELVSRHANNRDLVYRAVLLKRELTLTQASPSHQQIEKCLKILDELVVDQKSAAVTGRGRNELAEAARLRTMALTVPNASVVSCEKIGKTYRRGSFALRDVSFECRYGDIVGVVGRNGNGKTTLFRVLVGELDPDGGALQFPAIQPSGKVRWSRVRQHIAYVPQDLPSWSGSLRSNLHYEAAFHGVLGADNEREVDFIVERLGLSTELDKRWHELSGGYKLRFALARALVWKPKLLILDEPLANLDFMSQQVVLSDLRHLTDSLRYPMAVLISSQHLHEIEEVSDKLLLLNKGEMKYFGDTGAIGEERRVNRFELAGEFELPDLQAAFTGPEFRSVYYSGIAFVLTTSTDVTRQSVLKRVLDSGIPLTYFRDISRSAKSLLQDDGDE